jgi:hypothetical protein
MVHSHRVDPHRIRVDLYGFVLFFLVILVVACSQLWVATLIEVFSLFAVYHYVVGCCPLWISRVVPVRVYVAIVGV